MEVVKRTAQLNTGANIPLIGFGTVGVDQNEEAIKAAVITALQVGYRHFDTASLYNSERPLGRALHMAFQNGVVNREDVFVTTKLWNTQHNPVAAIKSSDWSSTGMGDLPGSPGASPLESRESWCWKTLHRKQRM